MATAALCSSVVDSRRSFLALLWSIVTILIGLGYLTTFAITMNSNRYNRYYNTDDDDDDEEEKNSRDEENKNWDEEDIRVSIASRAMAFSFFWTGMSSIGLAVAGSMVIGVISPSGTYLTCCTSKISSTTPLSIGIFIGSLVMYANMAFICAILFGQFNIRDYVYGQDDRDGQERMDPDIQWISEYAVQKSSTAFSFLCMFMSILYGGFACIFYSYQNEVMDEVLEDEKAAALAPSPDEPVSTAMKLHPSGAGYVGGITFESRRKINQDDIASPLRSTSNVGGIIFDPKNTKSENFLIPKGSDITNLTSN